MSDISQRVRELTKQSTYDETQSVLTDLNTRLDFVTELINNKGDEWDAATTVDNETGTATMPIPFMMSILESMRLSTDFLAIYEYRDMAYEKLLDATLGVVNAVSRIDFESVLVSVLADESSEAQQDIERATKAMLAIPAAIKRMNEIADEWGGPIVDTTLVRAEDIDNDGNVISHG